MQRDLVFTTGTGKGWDGLRNSWELNITVGVLEILSFFFLIALTLYELKLNL